jgi:hypothetical protein
MSRRKVAPTQLTRRPDRQGSIPKGREQQASRKRGLKKIQPVENRPGPHTARVAGQRATSALDKGKARIGPRGSKSRGARHAKHRKPSLSPSLR